MRRDLESDRQGERTVLMLIGGGIIVIILAVIATVAWAFDKPDWAESVFSAIVGGTLVKLADVLSALVQLSSNRQQGRATELVAQSAPVSDQPQRVEVTNSTESPIPVQDAQT